MRFNTVVKNRSGIRRLNKARGGCVRILRVNGAPWENPHPPCKNSIGMAAHHQHPEFWGIGDQQNGCGGTNGDGIGIKIGHVEAFSFSGYQRSGLSI